MFVVGVTLVKGYEAETDVRMDVGDTAAPAGYTFRFTAHRTTSTGRITTADRGTIDSDARAAEPVVTLHPEKRLYTVQNMPMTEAAIDAGFTRDLYVSLGDDARPDVPGCVRIYHKPFVGWIWGGCAADGARRPARRARPALPRARRARASAQATRRGRPQRRRGALIMLRRAVF